MPYPYHQLVANGPRETGLVVTLHVQEGAGGPLDGQSVDTVLDGLRAQLGAGEGVSIAITRSEIKTTYNL
ncbi:hypothetical protein [Streptomyces sp. KL116D]|uniref:hypothetical protein n=1 Tax=Streptomyces sp. KL116D TaxID=3045152 RepID=UPI003556D640